MALEDTFAGDLDSIRLTMRRELDFFEAMRDGRAWDDGLTGMIDPAGRADVIYTLQRKIGVLNGWIDPGGVFIGTPTTQEFALLSEFIAIWAANEFANQRFRYWCWNTPIEPPARGVSLDAQPVFTPAPVDAAGGANLPNITPTTEHEEQPPQS